MRAAAIYFALGVVISAAWIFAAQALHVEEWSRAWTAGAICGAFNLLSTQRLMKAVGL